MANQGRVNQLALFFQMTIKQLQVVYRQFNKKWFAGRLPAEVAMSFVDATALPDEAGLCTTYQGVYATTPIHSLHFEKRFVDCDHLMKYFLIHEMAHMAAYPNEKIAHDQAFQDQMCILAFKGALKELW